MFDLCSTVCESTSCLKPQRLKTRCVPNHIILLFFTYSMYCGCPTQYGLLHAACIQLGHITSSLVAASVVGTGFSDWSVHSRRLSWCEIIAAVQRIVGQNRQRSSHNAKCAQMQQDIMVLLVYCVLGRTKSFSGIVWQCGYWNAPRILLRENIQSESENQIQSHDSDSTCQSEVRGQRS